MINTMGADLRGLLAELHKRGQEHDVRQERHDDRLRNLEPETAALLAVLVRSGGRRRLLEIGTPTATPPFGLPGRSARPTGG
jgi:predicted O-methyltransferase YrrM